MSKGVNKVILVGHLGQAPEMRQTQTGDAVANVSLATSESWKDKQTGQQQERTEWHRLVFFKRLAEIVGQYLQKGSQIYVEGKLQTNKWQDKNGEDRYTTEIVVRDMQMLGGRGESTNARPVAGGGQSYSQAAPVKRSPGQQARFEQQGQTGGLDDEDIPF